MVASASWGCSGRAAEIEALHGAWGAACGGAAELVAVSGYSGVGKSTLVQQLDAPVVSAHGRFVSGKFDTVASTPYAGWVQLLRRLTQDLLGDDAAELSELRRRLIFALGPDAAALTDVVPELRVLLGPQAPAAKLPHLEAQARLIGAVANFVDVVARPERPLALFLDDVQWAQPASLALLHGLMSRVDGHLLVVIAFRSNEVGPAHPLRSCLTEIVADGTEPTSLELAPLDRETVARWFRDSLGDEDSIAGLAEEVHARTEGNPFFVRRMVGELVERGALSRQDGRWTWDRAALEALGVADNVAELLAARLARLEDGVVDVLSCAACIGATVSLSTLAEVLERAPEAVHESLWPALHSGLLRPLGDSWRMVGLDPEAAAATRYGFVHDRVQEAAYATLDAEARATTHLRIGRTLVERLASRPGVLFRAVDQLNAGRELLGSEERAQLARLDLKAGRRALAAVAFRAARTYLQAGVDLVSWDDESTAIELHARLALALQATGEDPRAVEVLRTGLAHASDPMDEVDLLTELIELHARTGEHQRCFEVGYEALRRLGEQVPVHPEDWVRRGEVELQLLTEALGDRPPEELLQLPELEDERLLRLTGVLATMAPGVWANLHTVPVISPWLMRLFVTHGNSGRSAEGYACWAMQLAAGGDLEAAGRWGALAAELVDQRQEAASWPSIGFVNLAWAAHWTRPLSEAMQHGRRSIRASLDTGAAANWAAWSAMILPCVSLAGGEQLDRAIRETRTSVEVLARRFNSVDLVAVGRGALLAMYRLAGRQDELANQLAAGWSWDRVHTELEHYPLVRGPLYACAMLADYALGRPRAVLDSLDAGWDMVQTGPGLISFLEMRFLGMLACLQLDVRPELVEDNLPLLRRWAQLNPEAHGSKALLVEALRDGDPDGLDAAIEAAHHPRDRAICLEAAGRHWHDRGHSRRAWGYLLDARYQWALWGAGGKSLQLDRTFAPLAGAPSAEASQSDSSPGLLLEARAVLKATRAISKEIEQDEILRVLLEAVLETAGAQRVALLRPDASGELVVRAQASRPTGQRVEIPWTLVHASWRGHRAIVLDDARRTHARDPHIAEHGTRSLLVHPIRRGQQRVGVLYLENDLTVGAFSAHRIEAVEILSAQAATSLEIAAAFRDLAHQGQAMARFLPTAFLRLLGKHEVAAVQLGEAVERDMVVLFSDVRRFTSRAESMAPAEVFDFMNRYLAVAAPVIRRHGGFVDKYIGDALMALFPTSADAVAAGIGLLEAAASFSTDLEVPLEIGVGIHKGRLMLGTIGEAERMDVTVLSDTVNIASRLERLTKYLHAPLIVSDAVQRESDVSVRSLGRTSIRGREAMLQIYEVLHPIANRDQTLDDFEAGASALSEGRTADAVARFERVLELDSSDATARALLARARRGEL